ncbi:MAG: hypothetical protein GY906_38705 [bacterium]|nr:hypothetical protein [bacterium]
MGTLDRSRVGSKDAGRTIRDRLPEKEVLIGEGEMCLLTFHAEEPAQQVTIERRGRDEHFMALRFEGFDEYELRTNSTQEDALLALVDAGILPENTDAWAGVTIPWASRLNKNPETGQKVIRLYPMDPELYEEAMKELGATPTLPSGRPKKARAPAKKASKRTKGSK